MHDLDIYHHRKLNRMLQLKMSLNLQISSRIHEVRNISITAHILLHFSVL